MKKIIYSILFTMFLLLPISKVDAAILTIPETLRYGEIQLKGRTEIDNLYIVGDKLYTAAVRAADKPSEIPASDIIKFNTETGIWTYADGREANITLKAVKKLNGVPLGEDEISSYDELIASISESNGADTLIIKKDIDGVEKPIIIDREVSIDGQGNTIHFTKQYNNYYGIKINTSDSVALSNLGVVVDERRTKENRTALGIINSDNVTIGELTLDSAEHSLYIEDSTVVISGDVDITGYYDEKAEIAGSSNDISVTNDAAVINNEELVGRPSIYVEDASSSVDLGPNTATENNGGSKGIYTDKENADYTMVNMWIGTYNRAIVNTNANFNLDVKSTKTGNQDFTVKAKVTDLNGATVRVSTHTLSDTTETELYTGNMEGTTLYSESINVDKAGTYTIEITVYDHSGNQLVIKDLYGNKTNSYEYTFEVLASAPVEEDELYIGSNIRYSTTDDTSMVDGKTYYIHDTSVYEEYRKATASDFTQANLDAGLIDELVGSALIVDSNKSFKGNIRYEVLESPEGANITIKYNGTTLKELNDSEEETSNLIDFTGSSETTINGTVSFEADINGYYEIDLHLIDETGTDVSVDSLDSVYVGADEE